MTTTADAVASIAVSYVAYLAARVGPPDHEADVPLLLWRIACLLAAVVLLVRTIGLLVSDVFAS